MRKYIHLLTVVVLIISLCGCQVFDALKSGDEENKTEIVTKPQSNDVANVITVSAYDFDTFNPLTTSSQSVKDAMKFVYEPLFTLDEVLNVVPCLAESYSLSHDGKTIDVKLRQDVLWHDGSEFTAADVNYTIKKILAGNTTYQESVSNISGCFVKDNYNIQIYLKRSMPNAAAILTFPVIKNGTSMNVSTSHKPIGTGAFAYNGKVSIDRYMLLASDCYYKEKAKIGGIYIDVVPDNRRYFTMFDSGNNDVCNSELIEGYEYAAKANVNVNDCVSNELIYIGINNNSLYLSDSNVRRAVDCFIDRTAIEKNIMYSSIKAVDTFINPTSPYYCGKTGEMRVDSVAGAEHLLSAGWEPQERGYTKVVSGMLKNLSLRLLVDESNQNDVKIAEKVKETLVANGIAIQLQLVPEDMFNQRIAQKDYDLFVGREKMNFAQDISEFLGSASNQFGYNNVTIDVITGEMATTTDSETLKELYIQLRDVLEEDMPCVPVAYEKFSMYMSARIENVLPIGIDGFYRDLQNWSIK